MNKIATAVLQKTGYTIAGWLNDSGGFNYSITTLNYGVKLRVMSQTALRGVEGTAPYDIFNQRAQSIEPGLAAAAAYRAQPAKPALSAE